MTVQHVLPAVVVNWGEALPCDYFHGLSVIIKTDAKMFRLVQGRQLADARSVYRFPACVMWNMDERASSGRLPCSMGDFALGSWCVKQGVPGPYLHRKTQGYLQHTPDYFLISHSSWHYLPYLHSGPQGPGIVGDETSTPAPDPARPVNLDYPSKCPSCSFPAYVGFSTIVCTGPHCSHRKPLDAVEVAQ